MAGPQPTLVGTVFRISAKEVSVRADSPLFHVVFECHIRGRLFEDARSGDRHQLAVGDRVELLPLSPIQGGGPFKGVIHDILARDNVLVRRVGRRKPTLQVLAANLDQLVVVSALEEPPLKTGLIDRYLVIAQDAAIPPALCLNKIDLDDGVKLEEAKRNLEVYRELGCPLVFTSARTGVGLTELCDLLKDKRSVLAGHSGVGKSKLAARIQPGIQLSSAAVDRRGRGRHTTTVSTLFPLDFGGELVDTPGVRELSIRHIERKDLVSSFVEFRPHVQKCHFTSCSHIPEPHCGIKEAVEEGKISEARYRSYCRLYEELS